MSFFNRRHFFSTVVSDDLKSVMEEYLQHRGNEPKGHWRPPADLVQVEDGYVAQFELSGVAVEDLSVLVCGNQLQISGIRRECCQREKLAYCQMEIHHGPFERAITLPEPVNAGAATARLENGMLEIFLPHARRRTSRIARCEIHIG